VDRLRRPIRDASVPVFRLLPVRCKAQERDAVPARPGPLGSRPARHRGIDSHNTRCSNSQQQDHHEESDRFRPEAGKLREPGDRSSGASSPLPSCGRPHRASPSPRRPFCRRFYEEPTGCPVVCYVKWKGRHGLGDPVDAPRRRMTGQSAILRLWSPTSTSKSAFTALGSYQRLDARTSTTTTSSTSFWELAVLHAVGVHDVDRSGPHRRVAHPGGAQRDRACSKKRWPPENLPDHPCLPVRPFPGW